MHILNIFCISYTGGFRCDSDCYISFELLCDGIEQCPNGRDEDPELCSRRLSGESVSNILVKIYL